MRSPHPPSPPLPASSSSSLMRPVPAVTHSTKRRSLVRSSRWFKNKKQHRVYKQPRRTPERTCGTTSDTYNEAEARHSAARRSPGGRRRTMQGESSKAAPGSPAGASGTSEQVRVDFGSYFSPAALKAGRSLPEIKRLSFPLSVRTQRHCWELKCLRIQSVVEPVRPHSLSPSTSVSSQRQLTSCSLN